MPMTCSRCGREGEPPNPRRIGFSGGVKEQILKGICEPCWQEWEAVEIKVINEYRLNFMEPEHRLVLKRACVDFLKLPEPQA
jgi:Fe-S cluster biosynthesis and repair protein YggX